MALWIILAVGIILFILIAILIYILANLWSLISTFLILRRVAKRLKDGD